MIQDIYEMFFGSEEETASEGKLYTMDDYMAAVAGGQAASANNAKEYIIQDYLDSGYTREESENKFLSNVMKKITAKYKSDANPSDSKYVRLYVQYAGMEQEDAEDKVYELRFNKNYPDYDWTTAQIKDYSEFAKPAQIPMNVYDDYIIKTYGLGKKDEILPIIDSLPISSEQKDALYYANGWSAKNIRKTPWH